MRVLFYVLAAVAGLIGLLGLIRGVEHLLVGDGLQPFQLGIGVVGLLLSVIWVRSARA